MYEKTEMCPTCLGSGYIEVEIREFSQKMLDAYANAVYFYESAIYEIDWAMEQKTQEANDACESWIMRKFKNWGSYNACGMCRAANFPVKGVDCRHCVFTIIEDTDHSCCKGVFRRTFKAIQSLTRQGPIPIGLLRFNLRTRLMDLILRAESNGIYLEDT